MSSTRKASATKVNARLCHRSGRAFVHRLRVKGTSKPKPSGINGIDLTLSQGKTMNPSVDADFVDIKMWREKGRV